MLSFKVMIFLILMQKFSKGPAAQQLTNEDNSHPFAADQGELDLEIRMYASPHQSHATALLMRYK